MVALPLKCKVHIQLWCRFGNIVFLAATHAHLYCIVLAKSTGISTKLSQFMVWYHHSYESWYGLLCYLETKAKTADFHWETIHDSCLFWGGGKGQKKWIFLGDLQGFTGAIWTISIYFRFMYLNLLQNL